MWSRGGCCGGPVVYPVVQNRNTGTEIIAIAILILVALGVIF